MIERHAAAGALVLACALGTAFAGRGMHKAPPESGPEYRVKGDAAAKITIVEFSDFQCPACRVAEDSLKQLMALYGKDVRFIFKQYPLERVHMNARSAALAAECAGKQGKFWPLHDAFYERQQEWGELEDARALFEKYEKAAGLDLAQLKACVESPETAAAIEADKKEAKLRWVAATPTFFVNGRRFVGKVQLASRAPGWIDKELKK